jgi:hypothetical protein
MTREGFICFRSSLTGYDSVSWLRILLEAGTHAKLTRLCCPEQLLLVSRYVREVLCVEITLNRAEIVDEY